MYQLGITKRRRLSFNLFGMALLGGALLGALGLIGYRQVFVAAATRPPMQVEPLWPTNNAAVSGPVTLRATVDGVDPSQYEMFWSVDNGQWNRMQPDSNNAAVSVAPINVTDWTWKKDGQYDISFIALMKGTWQPVTSTVRMQVSKPAVTPAPPATPAKSITKPEAADSDTVEQPAALPAKAAASQDLYADQTSEVARNALSAAATDPANAERWRKLASQPIAEWYGNWNGDVRAAVDTYVSAATASGKTPVLVAYNIPDRDCGSHSAGGSQNAAAYLQWIRAFASGIGQRQAMVVVEPDALAQLDCLDGNAKQQRTQLLSQAVTILKQSTDAKVYLDAGHADWHAPAVMSARLKSANVGEADGFSLNVSNFVSTGDSLKYGNDIAKQTGNKHFVIDTGRNGNGQDKGAWCNPAGRALGQAPTTRTNNDLADAFLWIKLPGASDGGCGPAIGGSLAPSAGTWWPQYALQLLRNSNW